MSADSPNRITSAGPNYDEVLALLRELPDGPSPDEFETALAKIGRNDGPALAYDYAFTTSNPREVFARAEQLAPVIHNVWLSAEYPDENLDHWTWALFFDAAGYRVDGVPATPPQQLTLYRGTTPQRLARMAWTTDRAVAQRFATGGLRGRPQGYVWQAQVAGDQLAAHITERGEQEYLVHPEALDHVANVAVNLSAS